MPFSATALFSFLLAWYNRENGVGGENNGTRARTILKTRCKIALHPGLSLILYACHKKMLKDYDDRMAAGEEAEIGEVKITSEVKVK